MRKRLGECPLLQIFESPPPFPPYPSSSATRRYDRGSYEIDADLMSVVLSAKKKDSPQAYF